MNLPPLSLVRQYDTHRLIPAKYSEGGESVLVRVSASSDDLPHIYELDDATNDRLLADNALLPGVDVHELVYGVPYYRIVNAAFCHAHPLGSRFNGPDRGAWYAAFELETAQAEIAYHKTNELLEINWLDEEATYDDYLADFSAELHDLRGGDFRSCLEPYSYLASQDLARRLLDEGSLGVVYSSVRRAGGTCLACFRPALVANVRKGEGFIFRWDGDATPRISRRA